MNCVKQSQNAASLRTTSKLFADGGKCTMKVSAWIVALTFVLAGTWGSDASATTLVFPDPTAAQGDQVSTAGDVTSARLEFDPLTGSFVVTWTAEASRPFNGNVVLNLNLGNSRLGGNLLPLAQTFPGVSSQTILSYAGTAVELTTWQPGDTIVTSGQSPQFTTAFSSGLVDLANIALSNRDNLETSTVVPAAAQATYQYSGNPFTHFSCGPAAGGNGTVLCVSAPASGNSLTSYLATNFVSATLALSSPLPANLALQDVRSFAGFQLTMNDGQQTLSVADALVLGAEFATDASGQIAAWRLNIFTGVQGRGIQSQNTPTFFDGGFLACCDPTVSGNVAVNFGPPGTWSGPIAVSPAIVTTVAPEPSSITRSTAAVPSYGTYRVTLTPASGKTFDSLSFTATTQVVDNGGNIPLVPQQNAIFVAPFPSGCLEPSPPYTTISCSFGPYNSPLPKVLTLIVSAPPATTPAPPTGTPGDKIKLTSLTSWDEAGSPVYVESRAADPVYTLLTEPDPTKFSTFLPAPGRVSTGTQGCTATNGCVATGTEPFITVANVPVSSLVSIDQTKPVQGLGSLANDLYTDFRIPAIFGVPAETAALTTFGALSGSGASAGGTVLDVTLRKHKSKIGSGRGSLIDALQILKQKVYYHGETTNGVLSAAGPVPVYLCLITGGPVAATATQPGRPCISEVKVYSKFNAPSQPELWGTFQWKLRFKSNGKLIVR